MAELVSKSTQLAPSLVESKTCGQPIVPAKRLLPLTAKARTLRGPFSTLVQLAPLSVETEKPDRMSNIRKEVCASHRNGVNAEILHSGIYLSRVFSLIGIKKDTPSISTHENIRPAYRETSNRTGVGATNFNPLCMDPRKSNLETCEKIHVQPRGFSLRSPLFS